MRFGSCCVKVGYGRAGLCGRDADDQAQALAAAGCLRSVVETASDARRGRPKLAQLIADLKGGDVLVVWRLDRLAISLAQLRETLNAVQARDIALEVLDCALAVEPVPDCKLRQALAALMAFDGQLTAERRQASRSWAVGRAGRRPALAAADIRRAKVLLQDPKLTVAEVARRFGVQPSTLYRHIPGGRSALVEIAA